MEEILHQGTNALARSQAKKGVSDLHIHPDMKDKQVYPKLTAKRKRSHPTGKQMKNFEDWFNQLVELTKKKNLEGLINKDDPESYRDYYEDSETPEDCLRDQLSYAD